MFNSNASSAAGDANYIEDVFQTWLYSGTGVAQTITNGVDLSTKGGFVWIKGRNAAEPHVGVDTVRGASNALRQNSTAASINDAGRVSAFTTSGFTVGTDGETNGSGTTYASWTFREQAKFFDVVTYTGDNSVSRQISHNLGSTPGCIFVKSTSNTQDWFVNHRSLTGPNYSLNLNLTDAQYASQNWGNSGGTYPTSTNFTVGDNANVAGYTYVAYLFAHDAGGFGLTGTDNVISCGSGTGGTAVNLGYEPQWVIIKKTATTSAWYMVDNMRGWTAPSNTDQLLAANVADAEFSSTNYANPTATGFIVNAHSDAFVYIAIRRGPMKVPTTGTSVFIPSTWTGNGNTGRTISSLTSPVDLAIVSALNSQSPKLLFSDRLRGSGTGENSGNMRTLTSTSAVAESNSSLNGYYATLDYQDSVRLLGSSTGIYNNGGTGNLLYAFKRAPGFFDEVCYTGNGGAQTIKHNLNVVPELIIGRNRTGSNWSVNFNFATTTQSYAFLNLTDSGGNLSYAGAGVFSGAPTSNEMYLVNSGSMNGSGQDIVAYLFASCPGVSKIGVYTGTGTTQTINCGFTAGARFVLIKRTDSTGDWYVWDSARGIVAGNDPYLLLNSTAAEVTGTDYVDTAASGFELSSTAPAAINASSGTYLFLAIA